MRADRGAGRPADGGAGLAGRDQRLPGGRRHLTFRAGDLDLGAVGEFRKQRNRAAIHLRADRRVADVGVDRIGEVDRRRPLRQRDQPALGREAEHLVVEQLELGVFEEVLGGIGVGQQRDGAAKARIGAALARRDPDVEGPPILVEGVGRDAVLGEVVHRGRCGSAVRPAGAPGPTTVVCSER